MNQGGFAADSPGGVSRWVLPPGFRRSVRRPSVRRCVRSVRRPSAVLPSGSGSGPVPGPLGLFCFCRSAWVPVFGSLPGRCPFPSLSFGPKASICGVSSGVRSRSLSIAPQLLAGGSAYTRDPRFALFSGGGTGSGSAFPGVTPGATHRGRHKPPSASQGTRSIRSSSCVCAARSASSSSMLSPCARHL